MLCVVTSEFSCELWKLGRLHFQLVFYNPGDYVQRLAKRRRR